MAQYRKKPVVIDAICWMGENHEEVFAFLADCPYSLRGYVIVLPTLEGEMEAGVGDWIIRGVRGEYYPCKPDIFDLTYEAA